jgi:hypothetical protein
MSLDERTTQAKQAYVDSVLAGEVDCISALRRALRDLRLRERDITYHERDAVCLLERAKRERGE